MFSSNHFHPIAGQSYKNRNSLTYLCLESENFSNEGLFVNVSNGNVLVAHGCKMNDDGTIEWSHSDDKGIHNVHQFSELYGFDTNGKSVVDRDDDEPMTWAEVFEIELEGTRTKLESLLCYDTKKRCIYENINPETYDEIMESAEMDAFEQYTDCLPEWNDETQYLFQTKYLDKIKPLAEEWEARIMSVAKHYDKTGEQISPEQTATEYYTDYFNRFWNRQ